MARFTTRGPKGDTGESGNGSPTDTYNKIILTNNGAIDNIKIGDDVYLGDGNISNHLVIKGQQSATSAGIALGSEKTEKISSNGTDLTIEADNDILLNPGSDYAYLNSITQTNRIATVGNLSAYQQVITGVSNTEIGYLANVTSDIQTQLNQKPDLLSPTITMASFASASSTTDPVTISTANAHGGAGFAGLMKLENSTVGATNTKKFVRLDSVGSLEIVSDDYSRTIFSLADSGNLSSIGTVNGSTIGDSGWQVVSSFSNGYSGNSVAYRRVNNVLYLRGNISGGTANTAAFTLPTGYRPSTIEHVVLVQKFGTNTGSYVTIGTNGEVVPMENAAWLSGISYPLG